MSGSVSRSVLKPRVLVLLPPRQKDGNSDTDARAAVNDIQKDKGEDKDEVEDEGKSWTGSY